MKTDVGNVSEQNNPFCFFFPLSDRLSPLSHSFSCDCNNNEAENA